MENAYAVLGVRRDASLAEIKRAFRKKAKTLHPDAASCDTTEEFRRLLRAYEILCDARQRSIFDESFFSRPFRRSKSGSSFDYRKWLLARDDDESRAKLIFFDLTHRREDDAVCEFKRMNMERGGFNMSLWFAREDFMDYGFILAEELVLRGEFYDASLLLCQIIRMERGRAYFRLFFPEVLALAEDVLLNKMEGAFSDELALDSWERALDLGFGKKCDSALLSKMAGAYARMGDRRTADLCLEAAGKL